MDLVTGAQKIIIIMDHCTKNGGSKIFRECSLPLTGKSVVDMIVTDKAVFEINEKGLTLIEISPFSSLEEIKAATDCKFNIANQYYNKRIKIQDQHILDWHRQVNYV